MLNHYPMPDITKQREIYRRVNTERGTYLRINRSTRGGGKRAVLSGGSVAVLIHSFRQLDSALTLVGDAGTLSGIELPATKYFPQYLQLSLHYLLSALSCCLIHPLKGGGVVDSKLS
jgi:hypothetical protein